MPRRYFLLILLRFQLHQKRRGSQLESFRIGESSWVMSDDKITISAGPRFQAAMILAIVADALQIAIFPMFVEGAMSPAEDVLDFGVGALMVHLLGWHWEFLPSFFAKLVPGVDLVPFWTLAVANVYRKTKRMAVEAEQDRRSQPVLDDPRRL
jgi:hypothetical protein